MLRTIFFVSRIVYQILNFVSFAVEKLVCLAVPYISKYYLIHDTIIHSRHRWEQLPLKFLFSFAENLFFYKLLFIYSFTHSFVHLIIHWFIHSFIQFICGGDVISYCLIFGDWLGTECLKLSTKYDRTDHYLKLVLSFSEKGQFECSWR